MKSHASIARISLAFVVIALVVVLSAGRGSATTTDTWTTVIPGVQWLHRVTSDPLNINVLVIDVTNPHVRVGTIIKHDSPDPDSGEGPSGMASRNQALAAVNADFFQFGTVQDHIPQGIQVQDGYTIPSAGFVTSPPRPSWAMDGTTLQSVIGVYGTSFPYTAQPWMYSVASGGPIILTNGTVITSFSTSLGAPTTADPRTALGITADGKTLILFVVDGRQPSISIGMTCQSVATMLKNDFGAYNAISFDSGGSSDFYLNGAIRNYPSDGSERPVANGIAVWDTFNQGPNPTVTVGTGFENPPFVTGGVDSQNGWSAGGSDATVQSANVHSGAQALELDESYAQKAFTTTADKVQWIDFWAKREGGQGQAVCYFGPNSSTTFGIVGFLNGGYINYYSGNTVGGGVFNLTAPYTVGQWYHISIRVDYNVNRYTVYVNGRAGVVGALYKDAASTSGLGFIKFVEAGTGKAYFDDVYVGNTRYDFPRVEPDTGSVAQGGFLGFVMKNAVSVSSWQIVSEQNQGNSSVPAGTIATIDSTGIVTAKALGSFIVLGTDNLGKQDQSTRITVTPSITVSTARALSDGSLATVGSSIVTGVFSGHLYAEQPDRASGIRINTQQPFAIGDTITAIGSVQKSGGETALNASTVIKGTTSAVPVPLTMNSRQVTRNWGSQLVGLDPSGLLVRVMGKVTRIEADRFYLNDGGITGDGLIIITPNSFTPTLGAFYTAVGPVGVYDPGSGPGPAIKPRSAADVVQQN